MVKILSNIASNRKARILERNWSTENNNLVKVKNGLAYAPNQNKYATDDEIVIAKINALADKLNSSVELKIGYVATPAPSRRAKYSIYAERTGVTLKFASYHEIVHTSLRKLCDLLSHSETRNSTEP